MQERGALNMPLLIFLPQPPCTPPFHVCTPNGNSFSVTSGNPLPNPLTFAIQADGRLMGRQHSSQVMVDWESGEFDISMNAPMIYLPNHS